MMSGKERWLAMHDRMAGEYLDDHPGVTESEAYERTADRVQERVIDEHAARIDGYMDRVRDEIRDALEEASRTDADPGL